MEKITVWGYLKEYAETKDELLKAVTEVFESGTLILGQKGRDFEQAYSDYIGVGYGIGCDNGTNAITLALKALEIGEGDKVITVSNTAIPTVSAIVSAGATPVFVDINPGTYLMDVTKVETAITPRTKAILPVHLFGQCVDMDPLLAIAQKHQLYVVEDCAQAHGAEYKGRKAGSMGDISTTSFYPTKILGAYGDGGMISTNNEALAQRLRGRARHGDAPLPRASPRVRVRRRRGPRPARPPMRKYLRAERCNPLPGNRLRNAYGTPCRFAKPPRSQCPPSATCPTACPSR